MKSVSLKDTLLASIDKVLASLSFRPQKITVALSGGLDSVCLLQVAAQWAKQQGVQLSAHHVHHGLSPHADDWLVFCEQLCRSLDVPFSATKLQLHRAGGESLEACARDARYHALAQLPDEVFLLAQHQDDQVETACMMWMRGSGPAGLMGMPAIRQADGHWWVRPWLEVPRSQLHTLAVEQGWQWVEDESNQDTRFDRNFWRQTVLPIIASRYPSYRTAITRSQQWMRESQLLIEELAEMDWLQCQAHDQSLLLSPFVQLSNHRAKNLLRYWLVKQCDVQPPSAVWLDNLLQQLTHTREDAETHIPLPGAQSFVGVFRGVASCVPTITPPTEEQQITLDLTQTQGEIPMPEWGGVLQWKKMVGEGIAVSRVSALELGCRPRAGGERLKLAANTPTKSLKQHYQEKAVPPWEREGRPLIYLDETLACVMGVGYSATVRATEGTLGVVLEWKVATV